VRWRGTVPATVVVYVPGFFRFVEDEAEAVDVVPLGRQVQGREARPILLQRLAVGTQEPKRWVGGRRERGTQDEDA